MYVSSCTYMYRKGCLVYLVFGTVDICTGKVVCCTWYYIQCIYVQERLPAVLSILYSVYMYRKGCLLYLVYCTVVNTVSIFTVKVACCTWHCVQCYVRERLPAVPSILYSVMYRKVACCTWYIV